MLWVGGGQGSGKSSVAWALSRRFDLQLYNVDHRTWVHEPRMARTEFTLLSMDERWVDATPERMLGWFIDTSRHRFRLVLEDLRRLPETPMAIVEGPQLFPTSVSAVLAAPDQALFLIPDARSNRNACSPAARCSGPPMVYEHAANAAERDLLISARFAREARSCV